LSERIAAQAGLDPELRAQAVLGIERLRRELGEDWPLSEIANGHPLIEYFTNAAPWTVAHLAQLGEAVELLSSLQGWKRLLQRLRHGQQAGGALLEVELAYPALKRGWDVRLEPPTQTGRLADLVISVMRRREERPLYVEAVGVDDFSLEARRDVSFQERLFPFLELHLGGLNAGGRLLVDPGPALENELLAVAGAFWEKCLTAKVSNELLIPGILELWATPFGDDEAKQAMLMKGHQDGFVGGVIDNPLRRLVRVIRAKLGQLPVDHAGLIVAEAPSLLFRSVSLEQLSVAVRQQIATAPAVIGVAFIRWTMQDGTAVERLERGRGFRILTLPDRLDQWKQVVFAPNPATTVKHAVQLGLEVFRSPAKKKYPTTLRDKATPKVGSL